MTANPSRQPRHVSIHPEFDLTTQLQKREAFIAGVSPQVLEFTTLSVGGNHLAQYMPPQGEFDFSASDQQSDGLAGWRAGFERSKRELATTMGLPLDHPVEVWLKGEIRLKGVLKLYENRLFVESKRDFSLELVVDGVRFTAAEIESCVRLD